MNRLAAVALALLASACSTVTPIRSGVSTYRPTTDATPIIISATADKTDNEFTGRTTLENITIRANGKPFLRWPDFVGEYEGKPAHAECSFNERAIYRCTVYIDGQIAADLSI